MATEAIVSTVVGRLNDLLIEEPQLLHEVRDEIQQVVNGLLQIKTFLPDVDLKITKQRFGPLAAQVRELVYDAEDVVETFLLKASASERRRTRGGIKSLVARPACVLSNSAYGKKFDREIKRIEKRMQNLNDDFRSILGQGHASSSSSSHITQPGKLKRFCTYPVIQPDSFVGSEEDVKSLVKHLVNERDDCYPVIFIGGMGGLGKTTLARKIYNHSTVKKHFSKLAWVSISQKWQQRAVLQRILIGLVHEKKKEILDMEVDKLVEDLLQVQQTTNCLVVLDDIWSNDAWDSLKAAFPEEFSGSKLMLTSRIMDVADHVNPKCFIHEPQVLDADESWELLRLTALPKGHPDTRDFKKMEEFGREMLQNCAGLPLAIVVLGGILVTKPSFYEWEKVYYDSQSSLKRGKGLDERHQEEVFDILRWSYKVLPTQLKLCFLYMGKFAEDEEIEAETLYQLWIAEGMVLSSDKREGDTMMQVAESYMKELVHKSMVQVKYDDDIYSERKIKSCQLHDIMRDLSMSVAEGEDFYKVIDLIKLRFDGLSKLETLENFDTRYCEVKDLPKLISLQKLKLRIVGNDKEVEVEEMIKYLSSYSGRYLTIEIYIRDDPVFEYGGADMWRQFFRNHKYNLEGLEINGKLPELVEIFGQQLDDTFVDVSLIHITTLFLWYSSLSQDPMPILERLPILRKLILSSTYGGIEMVCSVVGFPKLTELHLYHLANS